MKPPAHLLLQFTTTSSPTSKHLQSDPFAHPALASCQRRRHGRRGDVHARAAACVVRGPVHDSEVRPRARPARDPRRRRRKGPHSQGGRRQAAGVQARQPVGAVHGRPHAPAARLLQRRVLRRRGPRGQGQRRRTGNEDGVSMGPFHVLANDKLFMHAWSFLTEAVVDGGSPFNKAFDTPSWFDYASTDARFNHVFNVAMKDHSVILTKKLLELYKGFDGVRTLVDVGGGLGSTIHAITSRYPSINGINFDLPHVIAEAPEYHQDVKVKHVGGDMFKEVPAGADAILIKWILNCWGDEHFVTLLKNCYQALPANGKVINIECILPVKPEATKSAQALIGVDMQLLAYSPDGKERYKGEFVQLAKRAGFTSVNFTYIFANFWAIEYIK